MKTVELPVSLLEKIMKKAENDPKNQVERSLIESEVRDISGNIGAKKNIQNLTNTIICCLISSFLFIGDRFPNLWIAARIKGKWDTWLTELIRGYGIIPTLFREEGKIKSRCNVRDPNAVDTVLVPANECYRYRSGLYSYTTIFKILERAERFSLNQYYSEISTNRDVLNKLKQLELISIMKETRNRKSSPKKNRRKQAEEWIDTTPGRNYITKWMQPYGESKSALKQAVEDALLSRALVNDPQFRRLILTILNAENIIPREERDRVCSINPELKTDNLLCNLSYLNFAALDNGIEFGKDIGLIEEMSFGLSRFIYFGRQIDYLSDLLSADLSSGCINLKTDEKLKVDHSCFHARHLISTWNGRKKELLKLILKNTHKANGIVISLSSRSDSLYQLNSSTPKCYLVDWSGLPKDVCPQDTIVLNRFLPTNEEFLQCLKAFAGKNFHYIPELRFKICREFRIRRSDFNSLLTSVISNPPSQFAFSYRLRGDYDLTENHSPFEYRDRHYDRLRIEYWEE